MAAEGIPDRVGAYELRAKLGAGGMGQVYLGYTAAGRPVAVKLILGAYAGDPEYRSRFRQEVEAARRVSGLFTAPVVDAGPDDPVPWLATAYVPGPSLQTVLDEHRRLPLHTVLLLAAGIGEALEAIHRADLIHRDLKPANVLLAPDGPRVIDFGIARAGDATALTGTGMSIGTSTYMSPEQAQGDELGPASDVFALGVLLAHAASGVPAFGTGRHTAVTFRIVYEPPQLSEVPQELHPLLLHCLEKDPAKRPTPAEVVRFVREHPLMHGRPVFDENWLPAPVRTELSRHAARVQSAAPPVPATAPATAPRTEYAVPSPPSMHAAPTAAAPQRPVPAPYQPAPYQSAPQAAKPSRRGLRALLVLGGLLAALVLIVLTTQKHPTGDKSATNTGGGAPQAAPSKQATFQPVYQDKVLNASDYHYVFDLQDGVVLNETNPKATAVWSLALGGVDTMGDPSGPHSYFQYAPTDTPFAAPGADLTPDQCVEGVRTNPMRADDNGHRIFMNPLRGRTWCMVSGDGKRLAIFKGIEISGADPAHAKLSISYYKLG